MNRRKFKDPDLQRVYDHYRDNPPPPDHEGEPNGGRAFWSEYRLGYLNPDRPPSRVRRGSLGYGAWAAGVDNARAFQDAAEAGR